MKKIRISTNSDDFDQWINGELSKRKIDIVENQQLIKTVLEQTMFEFDTPKTRIHIIELISQAIPITQVRKNKLDEINKLNG